MVGAVIQRNEHTEPFDRCDGAGKEIAAVQRLQECPEVWVLRRPTHHARSHAHNLGRRAATASISWSTPPPSASTCASSAATPPPEALPCCPA